MGENQLKIKSTVFIKSIQKKTLWVLVRENKYVFKMINSDSLKQKACVVMKLVNFIKATHQCVEIKAMVTQLAALVM